MGPLIFAALILTVFGYAVGSALSWTGPQRDFPLLIGVPGVVLGLAAVTMEARSWIQHAVREYRGMDLFAETRSGLGSIRGPALILGWIFGLAAGIWLVGFLIAIPVFTFGYVKLQGRDTYRAAALVTLVISLVLFGFFDLLLNVPWYESIVERLLFG